MMLIEQVIKRLEESLQSGLLLGNYNEPLDAYGKRIVRAITVELDPIIQGNRSGPHYDPSPLMRFYDVATIPDLIDAQAEHIKRLQEQLPRPRDTEPRNYRRG